jgi:hypothetical protein
MIRDTSLDAYLDTKPHHQAQELRLLSFLERAGRPMTRNELAALSGIALSAICGRAHSLVGKGSLIELERRACRITGRSAHPLALPPVQLSLVA